MTTVAATTIKARQRPGDRIFSSATVIAGSLILAMLAAVAIFLLVESLPAFIAAPADFMASVINPSRILPGDGFMSKPEPASLARSA